MLNPAPIPVAAPPPQRQSDPAASYGSRQGPSQSFGAPHSPHQTHMSQPFNNGPVGTQQLHERSVSQGQPMQNYANGGGASLGRMGMADRTGPPPAKGDPPGHNAYSAGSISSSGPPQLSSLPFQNSSAPPTSMFSQHQGPGSPAQPPYSQPPTAANSSNLPPLKPVFGLSLDQLFERDSSAVPMVVYQCIQAVDLFGLEVEGIYRLSGTSSHVTNIKAKFDNGKKPFFLRKLVLIYSRCL